MKAKKIALFSFSTKLASEIKGSVQGQWGDVSLHPSHGC